MIPKDNSWTIVIVGHWNQMIFSPDWVGKKILKVEAVEMLVPIAPDAPRIYRNENISISISDRRVIFDMRKFNDECIKIAENTACSVLQELFHTPISAVGVNFGFKEDDPEEVVLKLFEYPDDRSIGSSKWQVEHKKLSRRLKKDNTTLNLTFLENDGVLDIDANFHADVRSASEAVRVIDNKMLEMKANLLDLLKSVYSLKLKDKCDGD
jgi:hypothetical protein